MTTDISTRYHVSKAAHPRSLVAFTVGDFCEFLFEDAHTVADALGIVLSKRGKHAGEPIPMAGFPTSHLDHYIARLEALGLAVHVEQDTTALHTYNDAQPLDFAALSPAAQRMVVQSIAQWDKQRHRAAALHERLEAYGLAAEAQVLRVRDLICNVNDDPLKLAALESIVAKLERPAASLATAINTGAGSRAALSLLKRIHDPAGALATQERLAVMTIVKADEDGAAFYLSDEARCPLIEAIEGLEESLQNRLEIAQEALQRLRSLKAGADHLN